MFDLGDGSATLPRFLARLEGEPGNQRRPEAREIAREVLRAMFSDHYAARVRRFEAARAVGVTTVLEAVCRFTDGGRIVVCTVHGDHWRRVQSAAPAIVDVISWGADLAWQRPDFLILDAPIAAAEYLASYRTQAEFNAWLAFPRVRGVFPDQLRAG